MTNAIRFLGRFSNIKLEAIILIKLISIKLYFIKIIKRQCHVVSIWIYEFLYINKYFSLFTVY